MTNSEKILKTAEKNGGTITTEQVNKMNISRGVLFYLVGKGILERSGRGVYILPHKFDDEFFNLQVRYRKGVFSNTTSLYLLGFTDRTPMLTNINRLIKSNNHTIPITKNDTISQKIMGIVKYINENYANEISLKIVATHFYMNETYLSRTFKRVTGFTYIEYLNRVRIQNAIKLLLNTSKNITTIAMEIGFNSTNHFCKVFNSIMGVSPLSYRKQQNGL